MAWIESVKEVKAARDRLVKKCEQQRNEIVELESKISIMENLLKEHRIQAALYKETIRLMNTVSKASK